MKVFTAVLVLTVVGIRLLGGGGENSTPSVSLIPPLDAASCGSLAYLFYFMILFNDLIMDRLRRRKKAGGFEMNLS